MMVITRIILADAPAPTPLIVDCSSDKSYRTTPQCPDTFLMLFVNLSHLLGLYSVTPCLRLLVHVSSLVWLSKCPTVKDGVHDSGE